VRCPDCSYPNDAHFSFCQQCGYKRQRIHTESTPPKIDVDLSQLDQRLDALGSVRESKPYQKQKSSLQKELQHFLFSLPTAKSLLSAAPRDIARFLVWKDKGGKTKVHTPACRHFGYSKKTSCPCPTRLAAGTVDSIIGKLRSVFCEAGRDGECNNLLGVGNPATHHSVKSYLRLIREEQAQARIIPRQAVPFFFDKLTKLCTHLRTLVFAPNSNPSQRYILARDLAFLCLEFYSGDRASDLGRVLTKEVTSLPNQEGLLFRHTFGKTLRGGPSNTFMIKRCQNRTICPVANLELYVKLCDLMSVNPRDGYLFRSLNSKGEVSTSPFTGSTVANRLSRHLKELNIDSGETMHSFRSGCAITLSLLGVSSDDVARHIGWRSSEMPEYYSQIGKVMNANRVATTLADSTMATSQGNASEAATTARIFCANNDLGNLSLAFP